MKTGVLATTKSGHRIQKLVTTDSQRTCVEKKSTAPVAFPDFIKNHSQENYNQTNETSPWSADLRQPNVNNRLLVKTVFEINDHDSRK